MRERRGELVAHADGLDGARGHVLVGPVGEAARGRLRWLGRARDDGVVGDAGGGEDDGGGLGDDGVGGGGVGGEGVHDVLRVHLLDDFWERPEGGEDIVLDD